MPRRIVIHNYLSKRRTRDAKKLIPKISSLMELRSKAGSDPKYLKLAVTAAQNLGGSGISNLETAMRWLYINAQETDERGIVAEVNFVRDLVGDAYFNTAERDPYQFTEGAEAARSGKKTANPYPAGSEASKMWVAGYQSVKAA